MRAAAELRGVRGELAATRAWVERIHEGLPASAAETDRRDLDEVPDGPSGVRIFLEHLLAAYLDPAVRQLDAELERLNRARGAAMNEELWDLLDPNGKEAEDHPPGRPISADLAGAVLRSQTDVLTPLMQFLELISRRLPVPAPEEYDEIASGRRPMPEAGHLAAAYRLVISHLAEAVGAVKKHGRVPKASSRKRQAPAAELLDALAQVVRERAETP